jgi:ketosteroid isomerase-like protein
MSNTAVASTHKRIVEQANAAFANNNMEGFLDLCTENLEWTMVGESTVRGKKAIREWMKSMDPGPPVIKVEQIAVEGDYAFCCGSLKMKDKDGREAPFDYCDVYRFQGDRIVALKAFLIKAEQQAAKPR